MKISRGTVATVSFTVTDDKGQVVGRTDPKHPVVTLVGQGYLVKGLEKAIDGHEKGDSFTVTLNPADAYGLYDPNLVQEIDRSLFGDFDIEEGAVFEADSSNGPMAVVVKKVTDDKVTVDGNHPLSGKVLNFLVTVEDVREATAEEKEHGHVHVDGHCPSEHHHCCGHHHHEDEEGEGHHCCGHHHHHEDEEGEGHHCCGHHHHHEDEEGEGHHCCGHHHHHEDEEGEGHHCCGHHHHHEDEEGEGHHCCGRHHHHDEEGEEHHCCKH